MLQTIRSSSALTEKARPEIRPGFTVRVHERIQEGGKERIQIFEGMVIAVHKGRNPGDSTITVRKIASGVGVEKIVPLHSPTIEKIEVKKVAKVRRAKLFFLRGRHGKSARLADRFTTSDEFTIAVQAPVEEPKAEEASETAAPVVEDSKEEVVEEKKAA